MQTDDRPVFRFAPSPNGRLHLGHALAALVNYELCRALNGRFLLRIEDIDQVRSSQANIDAALEDLAWLGLEWEQPVLHQSSRFAAYAKAAQSLGAQQLAYPCRATRKHISAAFGPDHPRDPDGAPLYGPICRMSPSQIAPHSAFDPRVIFCPLLEAGARNGEIASRSRTKDDVEDDIAIRLDMNAALATVEREKLTYPAWNGRLTPSGSLSPEVRLAKPEIWGDVVLVRKDTPASYHLSVVLDDAAQAITHIVRGKDLEPATDLHRLLQELLGLPTPIYHHHRLMLSRDGRKLSKSARDTSLQHLRKNGHTPDDIRRLVGL